MYHVKYYVQKQKYIKFSFNAVWFKNIRLLPRVVTIEKVIQLKHNQVGILCVTFCKQWKLFGWLNFYLKWYCDVWGMLPELDFFSILSSFFKLTFITTREMVYGHYKTIYITFFHTKIYYMLFSYQTGYIMWHSRLMIYIPWGAAEGI